MEIKDMLYEGKAKKVFQTDNPEVLVVDYKDDATAFNGLKKGTIVGKGAINNQLTNFLMQQIEKKGIPTQYIEELSPRQTAVKRVDIIPLEVIIRNKACGSFSKRLGVPEGTELKCSTLEYSYKDDDLGDPLINDYMALALGISDEHELQEIETKAFMINDILKSIFVKAGIELIDFKLEFGKDSEGNILLADEISPDTCRFWDLATHEKLDKDRFRHDLGNPEGAYQEVFGRIFTDRDSAEPAEESK